MVVSTILAVTRRIGVLQHFAVYTSKTSFLLSVIFGFLLFFSGCSTSIIHPEKDTIQFENIDKYVHMAETVYFSDLVIKQEFGNYDQLIIQNIPLIEGKYFVVKDNEKKQQIITVRGTTSIENAILDLQYVKERSPEVDMLLHSGFYEASLIVYHQIVNSNSAILSPEYETILVGHSLGGAIAAILGTFLVKDHFHVKQIITFGQPKFTNKAGSEKIKNLPLIRFVNEGDMVPMLPPWTPISSMDGGEYVHSGLEVFLSDDNHYTYLKVGQKKQSDESIEFWDHLLNQDVEIGKHLISQYKNKIKHLLNESIYLEYEDGYHWDDN